MGDTYPELKERKALIASVTEQEEVRFRDTIDRGLRILEEEFTQMKARGQRVLAGETAFRLYDTYGFPLDLTQVICDERSFEVDGPGYDRAMAEARARSEGSKVGDNAIEQVYRDALCRLPARAVRFVGYDCESAQATVVALIHNGTLVDHAEIGQELDIVLDVTPFYGEAGGQVGDTGAILRDDTVMATVIDAVKPIADLTVHRATVTTAGLKVGDKVLARVDHERRQATRRNHSATHLLHYALRTVLGGHAQQKGSLVGPDRLRFDFTHGKALDPSDLQHIEDLVNEKILVNAPIETQVLAMQDAKKLGATAIFEEKYGDVVRVLTMTQDSVELCGGTHAQATGDLGMFKILSEGGIAAGVRRIEAATGMNTVRYVRGLEDTLARTARAAKAGGVDVADKVEKIMHRERELEKQIADLTRKLALGGGGGMDAMLSKARDIGGVKVLALRADISDPAALREMAESLRDKLGDSLVVVGAQTGEKALLVATAAKSVTKRVKAGDIIRPIAKIIGGAGGGRPDMAQAGGPDGSRLDEALDATYAAVAQVLGVQ